VCGEDTTLLYVVGVVAVPIALMCGTLIMERLEHHVLGAPVATDDAALPEVHQATAPEHVTPVEREVLGDAAAA
jgi:hypothetical protein